MFTTLLCIRQLKSCLPCSPCLKLKPISNSMKSGFVSVNVEPYGGGLWHTWFDRDLSVAGRALVRKNDRLLQRMVRAMACSLKVHRHSDEQHASAEPFPLTRKERMGLSTALLRLGRVICLSHSRGMDTAHLLLAWAALARLDQPAQVQTERPIMRLSLLARGFLAVPGQWLKP